MTRPWTVLAVAGLALVVSTVEGARATPSLYGVQGGRYLDRVIEDSELMVNWFGVDTAGYVYGQRAGEHPTCWHPSDPDGTRVVIQFANASAGAFMDGSVFWAMGWDLSGIELLGVADGSFGATVYRRGRFRCADKNYTDLAGPFTLEETPRPTFVSANPRPTFAPEGAACWVEPEGVSCVEVNTDGVSFERRFALADIVADRVIDPTWKGDRTAGDPEPTASWQLRLPTWLPDGRFVVIAELGFSSGQRSWGPFPFLIEREAGDSARWVERVRPARPPLRDEDLQVHALAGVKLLTQLDGLEGIVGWRGTDAWVLPDDGGSPFLLDWFEPITTVFACTIAIDAPIAIACPGGGGIGNNVSQASQAAERMHAQVQAPLRIPGGLALPLVGFGTPAAPGEAAPLVRTLSAVRVVAGELDLDNDGLDRDTERDLGTSDNSRRSDGGCLSDGVEYANGGDPSDASDDPVAPARVDYRAESRLVEWFLDDLIRPMTATDPGWAPRPGAGPLCWAEACFSDGPGGGPSAPLVCESKSGVELELGTMCAGQPESFSSRWPSQDGSFEVQLRGRKLVLVDHEHGDVEPLLDIDATDFGVPILPPMAAGQGWAPTLTVVPVSRERVFVAHEGFIMQGEYRGSDLRVWVVEGPGGVREIYDHASAQCEAGIGPCASPPHPAAFQFVRPAFERTRVVGWLPGAERLVLAVGPPAETSIFERPRHLVGLHPERAAIIMGYDFALPGFDEMPSYLQPTGAGDLLHGYGFMDRCGEPVGLGLEGPGPLVSPPTTVLPGFRGIPESGTGVTFYGDLNLQGRFFEAVPYGLFETEPGDIFTLRRQSEGWVDKRPTHWMLMRSGPRGGLAPAWFDDVRDETLGWPSGLDIDAEGFACLTDRELGGIGRLHLFGPGTRRTPNAFLVTWDVPEGASDCLMEPDGSILVLQDRAKRLVRLSDPWSEPELVRELEEVEPTTLVRAPDGTIEVLDRQRGELGRLYLADGTKLEASGCCALTLDGVPLPIPAEAWSTPSGSEPWRVELAVRPDGRIVFQRLDVQRLENRDIGFGPAMGPQVYDLERQAVLPLTTNELNTHWLIARVPGGEPRDPWTGAPILPVISEPLPVAPTAPTAPTGGIELAGPTPGCASSPMGWLAAGLMLWVHAARRTRARPHRARPGVGARDDLDERSPFRKI